MDRPRGTRFPRQNSSSTPGVRELRPRVHKLASLTAGLAALFAIAAVIVAIALILLGPSPPATGAASLVPANALLYVHVSTDPSRPAVQQALSEVERLPGEPSLFASVRNRLDAVLSGSSVNTVDFATDVRPWLGREAAFAVLDTPGSTAGTLIVLDVRSRALAHAFMAAQGATPDGVYRRVQLLRYASGTMLAFLGHYLVLGQPKSVIAAIDVARGGARSLARSAQFALAAAGEPTDRVLDLFAPASGVTRALDPSRGLVGALGTLLDQPALSAVMVTVSPTAGGLTIRVHSTLDSKVARAIGGPARQFSPSLADVLPAGTTMLVDAGNLRHAVAKLLAGAARVGVAGRAPTLLARLGGALSSQGVDLNQLFAIFGSETAFAVVPGHAGSAPAPVLVGRTVHPNAARSELGTLEGPLTQAFAPPSSAAGIVPEVADTTVAGATVSQLTLAPGLQFDWAVSHGLVILSTSVGAIWNVISHETALADEPSYRSATAGLPSTATSLVFFDLNPLLRLAEQEGLVGGTALQALQPDLEQIRAIGLGSTGGESDTTSELQIQIR